MRIYEGKLSFDPPDWDSGIANTIIKICKETGCTYNPEIKAWTLTKNAEKRIQENNPYIAKLHAPDTVNFNIGIPDNTASLNIAMPNNITDIKEAWIDLKTWDAFIEFLQKNNASENVIERAINTKELRKNELLKIIKEQK